MSITNLEQKNYSGKGNYRIRGVRRTRKLHHYQKLQILSIIGWENHELTKLDGMTDIPNESSSSDTTAPELTLKVYPRT